MDRQTDRQTSIFILSLYYYIYNLGLVATELRVLGRRLSTRASVSDMAMYPFTYRSNQTMTSFLTSPRQLHEQSTEREETSFTTVQPTELQNLPLPPPPPILPSDFEVQPLDLPAPPCDLLLSYAPPPPPPFHHRKFESKFTQTEDFIVSFMFSAAEVSDVKHEGSQCLPDGSSGVQEGSRSVSLSQNGPPSSNDYYEIPIN